MSALPPDRRILLADCDAYFVQVARLEDPEGAGKERYLLVGGSPHGRGVVTSASYEVRRFGVRSGMPMSRALRLCPRAVRVPVPRGACSRKHREIRTVLDRFSPLVEAASVDEFYLDLSGTESLYHNASLGDVATRIRLAVLDETRIQISIGGGTSRLVAKLAVRRAKPAGVHVVPPGRELEFLKTLELAAIPGIGPKLQERLRRLGMVTIPDALQHSRQTLSDWLGEGSGRWLYERIRGIDPTPVTTGGEARSVSREETFTRDINDDQALETELLQLVVRVTADLRADGLRARTITVKLKDGDFTLRSASRTLPSPVQSDRPIYGIARELLQKLRDRRRTGERLLGVGLSHLTRAEGPEQLSLLEVEDPDALETPRDVALARAIDRLRGKFGRGIIVPGRIVSP
jgi:DNA polymerase-4